TWLPLQVNEGDTLDFEAIADTSVVGSVIYDQIDTNLWTASIQVPCQTSTWQYRLDFGVIICEPDTSLTIDFSQSTVWPTIPRSGRQEVILGEVDNVVDVVTIELTNGCAPISDHEVAVSADWVVGSNGHQHQKSGDSTPPQDSLGVFTVIDSSRTAKGAIVTKTGSDGKIRLSYKAPQYGGRVNIVAETVLAGDTLVNANQLVIEVPGLELFPFSSDYEKDGGTLDHPGPGPGFGSSFRPDTNHWGRTDFIDSLLVLVEMWNARPGSPKLYFNDLSLMRGGMFDVDGLWTVEKQVTKHGHNLHRVGRDVDLKKSGGGVSRRLEELITDTAGGCPYPKYYPSNGHYHMFFYPERYAGECEND
ncbi:MAG: hypothetical protein WBW88_05985, partial [Rhodothermales bacterium]